MSFGCNLLFLASKLTVTAEKTYRSLRGFSQTLRRFHDAALFRRIEAVVGVHRAVGTVAENRRGRLHRLGDDDVHRFAGRRIKLAEDMRDDIALVLADPELKTRKILRAETLDDVADAVVSAARAVLPAVRGLDPNGVEVVLVIYCAFP